MTSKAPTVDSIIRAIYGTDAEAASSLQKKKLIRSRSAVWNWKASGYFPTRLLPQIMEDAKAAGVDLALRDIPVLPPRPDREAAA